MDIVFVAGGGFATVVEVNSFTVNGNCSNFIQKRHIVAGSDIWKCLVCIG